MDEELENKEEESFNQHLANKIQEGVFLSLIDNLAPNTITKHVQKELPIISKVDKTQKIKKEKKVDKKNRDIVDKIELQSQLMLITQNALENLIDFSEQLLEQKGRIRPFIDLNANELLDFLQKMQDEYDNAIVILRKQREKFNLDSRGLLMKFVTGINKYFPELKEILYPCENRYSSSISFALRFSKLLEKNITPLLRIMSEQLHEDDPLELNNELLTEEMKQQFFKEMKKLEDCSDNSAKKKKKKKEKEKQAVK